MNLDRRKHPLDALAVIDITIHSSGDVGDNVSLWSHPERQIHYIISRMMQERDIWEGKRREDVHHFDSLECTCAPGDAE